MGSCITEFILKTIAAHIEIWLRGELKMRTIDDILNYVTTQEDKYYELSAKALDKGNMQASLIHTAEATAFQRVRYFIEMGFENAKND